MQPEPHHPGLIVAVSGKSGCGNTSVSKLVAQTLNLELINYTFRDMAREKGVTFTELCRLAEEDSQYDLYLDKKQQKLAAPGNCVLGSRLAIWLLKQADLKVYLAASLETRVRRISGREKTSFTEAYQATVARDERDRARYLRLYKIDNDKYDFADLIIDTECGDQHYIAGLIVEAVQEKITRPGFR